MEGIHPLTIECLCREADRDLFDGPNPACPIHGIAGPRLAAFFAAVRDDREGPGTDDLRGWLRSGLTHLQYATSIYMDEHERAREAGR